MENYLATTATQTDFSLSRKIFHLKGNISASLHSSSEPLQVRRLWVGGIEILPETAFNLRPFYECGFEWGLYGAAPSYTTALAICLAIFKNERIAENLYGCFREEFVQHFPQGDFELDIDLTKFMKKYKQRLHPDLYSCFCFSSMINSKEILLIKDPVSGEITADLAENYAMHNIGIANSRVKKLNERKQRLMFRFFAKEKYIIKGHNFTEVMQQAEEIMSVFYWRSLDRIIRKQFLG